MSIMNPRLAMVVFVLVTSLTAYGQKIEVGVPAGVKKAGDTQLSIGGDLNILLQLYPRQQYKSVRFYQSVVKAEFEEKQKELQNIKYPVKTQKLMQDHITEGLKGHGFILVGESDKGEKAAICGYYLEKGENIVRVTIMGNGLTYEANTNKIIEVLKAIDVKSGKSEQGAPANAAPPRR
jgi:hypothetical protein